MMRKAFSVSSGSSLYHLFHSQKSTVEIVLGTGLFKENFKKMFFIILFQFSKSQP